jgi:hypothetical protein
MYLDEVMWGADGEKPSDKPYPKAGENAPLEVRKAVAMWRKMPKKKRDSKPLLYWLLGSGTPPYKMTKKDSNYIGKSVKGMNCGNCRYTFRRHVNDELICSQIEGNIELGHWCRLWVSGDTAIPKPKKNV